MIENDIIDYDYPYLEGLNAAQREAVEITDGPLLVLAGAGTGKTRVLTTRIAHILATRKAYPRNILAVTFTNKAAKEMQHRIGSIIGNVVEGMGWLGTFHSIAAKILRFHAALVNRTSSFTILDDDDQLRLLKQIITAEGFDDKRFSPKLLLALIDRWKNRGWLPNKVPFSEVGEAFNGKAVELYKLYQARLETLNSCDFGDLLLLNLQIFQQYPDILAEFQNRFHYILVDEYQDTNIAQYLWLRMLSMKTGGEGKQNICCVGDDDQSIYGWRGAEVGNILRFEKDFPQAKTIRLEQNYRSTKQILGAASSLINHNSGRLGKTLWTDAEGGSRVLIKGTWDGDEEARMVSGQIEHLLKSGESASTMAVLVRASMQMRAIEERFINAAIAYRVIGGPKFYERAEIRDAIAYLRLIAQPHDDLAFERIINKPKRGLGDASIQVLYRLARQKNISLFQAAGYIIATDELRPKAKIAVRDFIVSIERWRTLSDSNMPHHELAEIVLDESGYTDMLLQDKTPENQGRLENLKELIRSMSDFENLNGFLEHVSLVMENVENDFVEKVTLMTLHAAKGLEFKTVFLTGWEEGLFPSQRSLDENGLEGLEEERRLAYVGITRARENLLITHAANRRVYNQWQACTPSRFLEEIDPKYCDKTRNPTLFAGYQAYDKPSLYSHFHKNTPSNYGGANYGNSNRDEWKKTDDYIEQRRNSFSTQVKSLTSIVSKPQKNAPKISQGQLVKHIKFGKGVVKNVDGSHLTVQFEAGEKSVLSTFVELV